MGRGFECQNEESGRGSSLMRRGTQLPEEEFVGGGGGSSSSSGGHGQTAG